MTLAARYFRLQRRATGGSLNSQSDPVREEPMMNQTIGWMNGWISGGMWTWVVFGALVVVLLVIGSYSVYKR
jgi:hypothetical protein